MKPVSRNRLHLDDRALAADGRQRAEVAIAERRQHLAFAIRRRCASPT